MYMQTERPAKIFEIGAWDVWLKFESTAKRERMGEKRETGTNPQ